MFDFYVQKNENKETCQPSESGMKNWILQYAEQSSSDESLDSEGHDQEQVDPVSYVIYSEKTLVSYSNELNSSALLPFFENIIN